MRQNVATKNQCNFVVFLRNCLFYLLLGHRSTLMTLKHYLRSYPLWQIFVTNLESLRPVFTFDGRITISLSFMSKFALKHFYTFLHRAKSSFCFFCVCIAIQYKICPKTEVTLILSFFHSGNYFSFYFHMY